MVVLREDISGKQDITNAWIDVLDAYSRLRENLIVFTSRCDTNKNLKLYSNNLIDDLEDYWDSSLDSMQEDILDEYYPVDYEAKNYEELKYAREHAFDRDRLTESGDDDPATDSRISNLDAQTLVDFIKTAETLKAHYTGKDRKAVIADCDAKILKCKNRLKELNYPINESVYSDLTGETLKGVEQPALTINEIEPEGPAFDKIGITNMIHDLLISSSEAVQNYNNAKANLEEYPEIIELLQNITNDELSHIGELQKALEIISPNTTKIKEGEEEASQIVATEPEEYETTISTEDIDDEF